MKKLEMYGILEMDATELKKTDGGGFVLGFIVGAIVGGLLYDGVKSLTKAYIAAYTRMGDRGMCHPIIP